MSLLGPIPALRVECAKCGKPTASWTVSYDEETRSTRLRTGCHRERFEARIYDHEIQRWRMNAEPMIAADGNSSFARVWNPDRREIELVVRVFLLSAEEQPK